MSNNAPLLRLTFEKKQDLAHLHLGFCAICSTSAEPLEFHGSLIKNVTSKPCLFHYCCRETVVIESGSESPLKLVQGDKQIADEVKNEEETLKHEDTVKINDLIDFV